MLESLSLTNSSLVKLETAGSKVSSLIQLSVRNKDSEKEDTFLFLNRTQFGVQVVPLGPCPTHKAKEELCPNGTTPLGLGVRCPPKNSENIPTVTSRSERIDIVAHELTHTSPIVQAI
eukprot:TCALIF_02512-PA protein Name:"Protein of unknown function" AED:0.60 eAED:0.60 QI:0/0/0/0.66/1/1/3/0/117